LFSASFVMNSSKKKVLVILLAVLVLGAASAVWIMRGAAGPTDAAALLPAETVALASLPDLPRSASRWPKTILAKIGAEPEMKAFLERPIQHFTKNRGGHEAAGVLWQLKPGRIFVSVVSMDSNDAALLVGFQFWGGKSGHDVAVARLREEISRGGPAPEIARETYNRVEIASSKHQGFTLYNASQGQWGFLSNNLAALKDAIDRAAGRKKDDSLAENARYKEVLAKLIADPDLLLFCQPQSALETLLEVGSSLGAQPVPQQVEQLRKVEAVGATTKFDEANLRDAIFVLRRNPPDVGSLNHASMKFTSPETAVYFAFASDFRQILDAASNAIAAGVPTLPAMQSNRLAELIPQAFGPDCAISLWWTPQQIRPSGFVAVQIRDKPKAEESVRELLTLFPDAQVTESEGIRYLSFPSLQSAFVNPTIALDTDFLLLGVDPGELGHSLQASKVGASLEKSPVFSSALPAFKAANEVFGFADTKLLFERGFPLLRQVIIFGAAVVPGASDVIDASKLPETASIAKHLQPIIYSQTRIPEGYLVESSGPITMNQAALLGGMAGAWFFKPTVAEQ
jgi:Protein of unknown function (DUF3352)